jgi:hypothetical protein
MSLPQNEGQELSNMVIELAALILAKGIEEDDWQISLLGHTIMIACKAINDRDRSMLLQHHLNEFIDSVHIVEKTTTLAEVAMEKASQNQN